MFSPTAGCRATRDRSGANQKTKAAEPEFDRLSRSEISRKPKLTARPQYEAHAHVIYFDFFLAFFFFVAMTLFPCVCEPTAGLV
jgi:hypothetical protein